MYVDACRPADRCRWRTADRGTRPRPGPATSIFEKLVSSKSTTRVTARERLGADRRAPVLAGPTARPRRRVAARRVRAEPVRALPAALLAELASELDEPRVRGRAAQRPAAGALLVRVVDVVVGRVHLDDTRDARSRGCGTARRSGGCPSSTCRTTAGRRAIHSAITRPTPPAPAMPCAQNPAATNRPCTSLSPSTNSLSGVKPSGPLTRLTTSAVSAAGTRRHAFSISGAKRSQSSGSNRLLKSAGTPCTDHGAGSRS